MGRPNSIGPRIRGPSTQNLIRKKSKNGPPQRQMVLPVNRRPRRSPQRTRRRHNHKKNDGKETSFTFGNSVSDEIGGAAGQICWRLEGDKMVGVFTIAKSGKEIRMSRFIKGGNLVQTMGFGGKDSKRVFKKN